MPPHRIECRPHPLKSVCVHGYSTALCTYLATLDVSLTNPLSREGVRRHPAAPATESRRLALTVRTA